ncbi:MAG: TetR/AcrR family transcriptional regulator [Pararhodobacter sp.]
MSDPTPANALSDPGSDPRRAAILGAAFEVFRQYGFRRTSMEDIARAAGLSRASLYLHYRNKQDIFRSLVRHYFDATEKRVRAALAPGLAPEDALGAVFAAKAGPEMEAMFASPHGEDLLDANFSTSADIVKEGEERIAMLLADWMIHEDAAGRLRLEAFDDDAQALARTMIAALTGIKAPAQGIEAFRAGAQRLAQLFGRALAR